MSKELQPLRLDVRLEILENLAEIVNDIQALLISHQRKLLAGWPQYRANTLFRFTYAPLERLGDHWLAPVVARAAQTNGENSRT